MVKFNALKIIGDCKSLFIDAFIEPYCFYKNIYIDSVIIDTQDTFVASGPSSKPVCKKVIKGNRKHITLTLDKTDFNVPVDFSKDIFFVYVLVKGSVAPETPCGFDDSYSVGVAVDLYGIYSNLMYYIREIEERCVIHKQLIDKYLQFKAFTISLKTGNHVLAIRYWNRFFRNKRGISVKNNKGGCGCNHGRLGQDSGGVD